MNWDNLFIFTCIIMPLFLLAKYVLIRPLEKRLESALDHQLAKEIARSIYHECFKTQTLFKPHYTPDDSRRKRILHETLHAFKTLITTQEKNNV